MNAFQMPDRKVLIGALSAVLVYALTTFARQYGYEVPADVQVALTLLVGFGVSHVIPLSKGELVKKIDDEVVHAAQVDPKSNVSYVIPPVPVPPGEAPTIVPPAPKTP